MVDTSTEAVERLMDGVTPGPWRVEYKHGTTRLMMGDSCQMCNETYYPWVPDNERDWHFIATARDLVPALLAEREAQAARADAADADVARRLEMHECAMAERDDCIEDWSKANDRIKALLAERDALKKERDEATEGWHIIHPNITVQDAARALLDADGCPNERICEIADEIHGAGASMNRAICVALRAIADTD